MTCKQLVYSPANMGEDLFKVLDYIESECDTRLNKFIALKLGENVYYVYYIMSRTETYHKSRVIIHEDGDLSVDSEERFSEEAFNAVYWTLKEVQQLMKRD